MNLSPTKVLIKFLWVIALVNAASVASILAKYYYNDRYYQITRFFDAGIEDNIPTIYSVIALAFAGFVCFLPASVSKLKSEIDRKHWLVLGCVMLFLAFDEGATIHEMIGSHFHDHFESGGYLYWLWVVPYGVLTAWFAAAYFPFLMRLPSKTRLGLVLSGAIFVGGAIGVEMISAAEYEAAREAGVRSLRYYLLYSLEEFLEMFGIALFVYYVLDYAAHLTPAIQLTLRSDA
jgi:hypothetical protein